MRRNFSEKINPGSSKKWPACAALLWVTLLGNAGFGEIAFPQILSHDIEVELEPGTAGLAVEDRVTFIVPRRRQRCAFTLSPDLAILGLRQGESEAAYSRIRQEQGPDLVEVDLSPSRQRTQELVWQYRGAIRSPVTGEKALSFVRGEESRGHIGAEGIYLAPQTAWYPDHPNSLCRFRLRVSVAQPYRILTQGDLLEERTEDGKNISLWNSELPADGLVLVGNRFQKVERGAGSPAVAAYFMEEDVSQAELFLDAAGRYLSTYSEIFGPYPYSRFSIVQNFFSTGHGLPGFTLLDPHVIRRGKESLKPGYLDHEIVHCWWGNHVFVDGEKGNWCEALTTYWANYFQKELLGGPEEAAQHRRQACLKYSVRVPKEKDYPLRQFVEKRSELDGEIGYGKGFMFFHQVRRRIGDPAFRAALQQVVRTHGGRRAGWEDFEKAFERASGKSLSSLFASWLDEPGGPEIELQNVSVNPRAKGWRVKGRLLRTGGPQEVELPITLAGPSWQQEQRTLLSGPSASFEFLTDGVPRFVHVDADFHGFRRIPESEWTPCLNGLLLKKPVIVVGPEDKDSPYQQLAAMVAQHEKVEKKSLAEVSPEDLKLRSLLFLGPVEQAVEFQDRLARAGPGEYGGGSFISSRLQCGNHGFTLDGQRYEKPEHALLAVGPQADGQAGPWVGVYAGLSAEAVARWRYVFYYGWDSFVLFSRGSPVLRGEWESEPGLTRLELAEKVASDIRPEPMMETVRFLSGYSRFPGNADVARVQAYLIAEAIEAGLEPVGPDFLQRFQLQTVDLRVTESVRQGKHPGYPNFVEVHAGNQAAVEAANVLAYLKAGHPSAKDEVLVLSAHYDSLGWDDQGRLFPGADDNASGAAAVLEIARALAVKKRLLRRSILFALFDAEEWELLGSKFFVEHPPIPLPKVAAMLNLDSIGAGPEGKVYLVGASVNPALAGRVRPWLRGLRLAEGKNIDAHAFRMGSDHFPFHEKGIPVLDFFAGDYRRINGVEDTADRINPSHLTGMARLAYLTMLDLATEDHPLSLLTGSSRKPEE